MPKRNAFTLVELLVVIAIIAILMSILIPALTRVKAQAGNMVDKSNLRTYGLVGQLYLNDNDHKFTNSFTWLHLNSMLLGCSWHDDSLVPDGPFWPYIQTKKVSVCPVFKSFAIMYGCPSCNGAIPVKPVRTYVHNAWLGSVSPLSAIKDTEVKRPAAIFWFSEQNLWPLLKIGVTQYLNNTDLTIVPLGWTIVETFGTFHGVPYAKKDEGYANMVCVDGHVEATPRMLKPEDLEIAFKWASPNP